MSGTLVVLSAIGAGAIALAVVGGLYGLVQCYTTITRIMDEKRDRQ